MSRTALLAIPCASALLAACATSPVPVTELTPGQAAMLPGFTEVSLADAGFSTAALAWVDTKNGDQSDTQRGGANVSAAYAGTALPSQPAAGPATSGAPPNGTVFDFKKSGDSAQGWATMTPSGMPFLFTQAFGKASAAGTASWRARVQLPANATNLYVQFRLPKANLQGFDEVQGPSIWQSRLRVELQMNGQPVWSSENTRISLLVSTPSGGENCGDTSPKGPYLATFGRGLGFTSNPNADTPAKTVTLNLGSLPAGQAVDVTMIVRTDALVQRPCCPHDDMNNPELFCTRATAQVSWDNGSQPVRFWVGPNIP